MTAGGSPTARRPSTRQTAPPPEEVLPGHVALAVVALTNGTLPVTTALIVPVDSGVPQALFRNPAHERSTT